MELSFTQGRWNHQQWGGFDPISNTNAKPIGVELSAVFDVPHSQIDSSWKNLTHALSGLFCASINFLESQTSYTSPRLVSRYVLLPREAVCTENLTPWLKLLPCRDKEGIATLMNRPSVYKAFYHSQKLRLFIDESHGITLEQTLTVVLQPHDETSIRQSWSLSTLFGRKVVSSCVLAKSSNVYLQLESRTRPESYELSLKPHKILYMFEIDKLFDLTFTWKLHPKWSSQQTPLHATRFLIGNSNATAILLESTGRDLANGHNCTSKVNVLQMFPWYIKVYYHTLRIFIDQQEKMGSEVLKEINVSPSIDKVSSGMMEIVLELPCQLKSAVVTIEYDKGFIHIDEYPPDANQGFDIPSALITFPNHHSS